MANKRDDNRRKLVALIAAQAWQTIGLSEWNLLRESFPDVSETALRKTLLEAGVAIAQPWRGVDLHSLEGLEQTLADLADFYTREPLRARQLVIAAKDKARFAARNEKAAAEKRALKNEMVEWMLVWLNDPAIFAAWARLRKQKLVE